MAEVYTLSCKMQKLPNDTLEYLSYLGVKPEDLPQPKKKKRNLAGELTKAVIQMLTLRGCVVTRLNSGMARAMHGNGFVKLADKNWPDIIGYKLSDGRMVAVEIKAGRDVLSPGQTDWLARAKAAGVCAGVARSVDDVDAILAQKA